MVRLYDLGSALLFKRGYGALRSPARQWWLVRPSDGKVGWVEAEHCGSRTGRGHRSEGFSIILRLGAAYLCLFFSGGTDLHPKVGADDGADYPRNGSQCRTNVGSVRPEENDREDESNEHHRKPYDHDTDSIQRPKRACVLLRLGANACRSRRSLRCDRLTFGWPEHSSSHAASFQRV